MRKNVKKPLFTEKTIFKLLLSNILFVFFLNSFSFSQDNQLMNLPEPTGNRFVLPQEKVWPENVGEANVCLWNDDKYAAATLTIDDNIEYEHSWWLQRQQDMEGLKFTWFVIKKSVSSWDKYQALIDAGNEVQGHDGCNINDYDEAAYRSALEDVKNAVNDNLTGQTCLTYAYPCGKAEKVDVAKQIFIAMRGVYGVLNNANNTNYLNLNSRSATNDVHDVQVLLDPNEKLYNMSFYRGWLSYHYHGLNKDDKKAQTITFLEALHAEKDNIWISTFSKVAKYGQERDSHTLNVTNVSATKIQFTLTDNMNDEYYDFPLTVKVRIDNSWDDISALQDGKAIEYKLVTIDGNLYALVKAVPDKGEVTIVNGPTGNIYYCDPEKGSMANDGSEASPWSSLEEVFKAGKNFQAGDYIYLLDGYHGIPVIKGNNTGNVVIASLNDGKATMSNLSFESASYWKVKDVTISPSTAPTYVKNSIVYVGQSSSYITVENSDLYSVPEPWTIDSDWTSKACHGVYIEGKHVTISGNHIKNVKHGFWISRKSEYNLISGNIVENIAADGIQSLSSYDTYEYNTIKNCYDVDGNHDDGIQLISMDDDGKVGAGNVVGITIRGNTIISNTDPSRPLAGNFQGIGCFDGMFTDWVVENNVVITSHWHGISLYGAVNCKIINNTVIDADDKSPGPVWIKIDKHKDGTLSTDNVIRNNICTDLANDNNIGEVDNNIIISYSEYNDYFVDFANYDLRLRAGCKAIDAGAENGAPVTDIEGAERPYGNAVDLGAYEYSDPFVPVSGITLELARDSVHVGDVFELLPEFTPANATNQNVTWSINNTDVLTIDDNGKVIVLKTGAATITVTTDEGSFVANLDITVYPAVGEHNVALLKPVTVSAFQNDAFGSQPGEFLVDGDASEAARWSAENYPQWAEIDLGANYDLTKLYLYTYKERAYQFTVEAKPDGGTYVEIIDNTDNVDGEQPISHNLSATARYVKITVTGAGNYNGAWISLLELELIGSKTPIATKINDTNTRHSFQIYPNPSNGDFRIDFGGRNKNISIVDLSGKLVFSKQIENESIFNFPAGKLQQGIYIVSVSDGLKTQYKKLIVK